MTSYYRVHSDRLVEELRNNEILASNQKFDLDRLSKIKKPIKVAIKDESKLKVLCLMFLAV
jgi:hypothetical protein